MIGVSEVKSGYGRAGRQQFIETLDEIFFASTGLQLSCLTRDSFIKRPALPAGGSGPDWFDYFLHNQHLRQF